MCGLGALYAEATHPRERRHRVERMLAAQAHRGPDDQGFFETGPLTLGHLRLAVDQRGDPRQPRVSDDGHHAMAFVGEIANLKALRQTFPFLRVHEGKSDGEILFELLKALGQDALAHLSGMFALVFWDQHQRRGFAARDALGVKGLVYAQQGRELLFASEIRGLRAGLKNGPPLSEHGFLDWWIMPAFSGVHRTVFQDVSILPAGHLIDFGPQGIRILPWADRRLLPSNGDAEDRRHALASLLAEVFPQYHPGRAGSLFLSGGLDSSLLAQYAGGGPAPMSALALSFPDEESVGPPRGLINESADAPFAKKAAAMADLDLHWVPMPGEDWHGDLLAAAQVNDRLVAWEQELSQFRLARAASAFGKVAWVGDAADELFYGYHFLLDPTKRSALDLLSFFGGNLRENLLLPRWRRHGAPLRERAEFLEAHSRAKGWDFSRDEERPLAKAQIILDFWLGRLLHNGDVHTMAQGVEARVPFADARVFDFARRLSPQLAMTGHIEKGLLRKAAPEALPPEIRWRKKSALPKRHAVEAGYRRATLSLCASGGGVLGAYLDLDALEDLARAQGPLDENQRTCLFSALCFQAFCDARDIAP
jgi:asparagine synthase (glutamine-hydrolysing)